MTPRPETRGSERTGTSTVSRFSVIEVPDAVTRQDETLGTKPKFWFRDPGGELLLFKRGRVNEDWSEKVAAEVARAIGLPAAEVELARSEGQRGTVSRSFLEAGDQMYHGNELLLARDPGYPLQAHYRVRAHTVEAVFETLAWYSAGLPPGIPAAWQGFDGCDLMVGYLALDALVSNTDRHHENWAVIRRGRRAFVAPSYDHAASLGRNETERRMWERLDGRDPRMTVSAYVKKGRSALYEPGSSRALGTVEAFRRAAAIRPSAARYWTARIRDTGADLLRTLVDRVPDDCIPAVNRRFAQAILLCNRERLVADDDQ